MDKVELPLLKSSKEENKIPVVFFTGIGILFVLLVLSIFSVTFKRTYKMKYTEYSDLDYKVYLKKNNFFEEEYQEKDKQYISELISYIDTDFNYKFVAGDNIDMNYKYRIEGELLVNNQSGKNILKKTYELVPSKTKTLNSEREFKVAENLIIDYGDYNKIASEFVNKFGINANSYFVVKMYVDVSGKHEKFENDITNDAVITLTIPLADDTTDIEMDYDTVNNADAILQYSEVLITNKVLFISCIIFAILDIVIISILVLIFINTRSVEAKYQAKLKRIKADYCKYLSETIITERVDDMLKTRSLRIVILKTFESLLDLRDTLGKQILYHEEKTGEECVFYIITENIGYIYVMNLDEFKRK